MKTKSPMSKTFPVLSLIFAGSTAVFTLLYQWTAKELWLTLAITFGTMTYHFAMRLCVGFLFQFTMRNRADYTKRRYQMNSYEKLVYEKLHVKKWKNYMPTYNPDFFDPKLHTWEEIAQSMCQAELVHETIVVLSFVPILAGHWFGAYPVFLITSVLAAMCDLLFVIVQRYNRPRIVRCIRCENPK